MFSEDIFAIEGPEAFARATLETFRFQYERIPVYREFCDLLGRNPQQVAGLAEIPFLPIEFFKSHRILDPGRHAKTVSILRSGWCFGPLAVVGKNRTESKTIACRK